MHDIADFVPGGIWPTDVWHRETNDGACSRCLKMVSNYEAPLTLWSGDKMLIYCTFCTGGQIDELKVPAPLGAG